MTAKKTYDVFISHAGEDKEGLVRPLAKALSEFGVHVWYDEFTLTLGDSLSKSIDMGLAGSEYGLVVLSPNFLKKGWPDYELRGLLAKEIGSKKVILPIWHELTKDDLLAYSPSIADKKALRSDELSVLKLAVEVIKVVRPDLFKRILRKVTFLKMKGEIQMINPKELKLPPPAHDQLPDELIGRIRLVRAALLGVDPHSMKYWIDGFRGDSHPSREVRIFERIAACYLEYVSMTRVTTEQCKHVFSVLVALSYGIECNDLTKYAKELSEEDIEKLKLLFHNSHPPYDMSDDPFPQDYVDSSEYWAEFSRHFDKEEFPVDVSDDLARKLIVGPDRGVAPCPWQVRTLHAGADTQAGPYANF
jgi:hypothetical protein